MLETPTPPSSFDVRSPLGTAIPREFLRGAGPSGPAGNRSPAQAEAYDRILRWLMASDQTVSIHLSRALVEVQDSRLYRHEGHVLWSAYLKAFVPLTQRWCQQEMSRERKLRLFPRLAAAFEQGRLCKSRVRVILKAVTAQTEEIWLAWGTTFSVRKLEILAQEEMAKGKAAESELAREPRQHDQQSADPPRRRRRVVNAPPAVAVLVAEAVDLARKVEGYQVSRGAAIEAMAMEAMSGVHRWPDGVEEKPPENDVCRGGESILGDHQALIRELGRTWEEAHRQREESSGQWSKLSWEFPEVILEGAPADDASAHQRVVFWSQVQGRLDAVRGRLLRFVRGYLLTEDLRFEGLGQYARDRMGLTAREAEDLIRLDDELSDLPVVFRMYAAGRLGRSAAWLVAKVVRMTRDKRAERAWVAYALAHTFRKLEAAVEAAELHRQADWRDFERNGGRPPQDKSFAEVLRMCSHFKEAHEAKEQDDEPDRPMARVTFVLDEEQVATYEQALRVLRGLYGEDRPEWWCVAVMARHFLETYADADEHMKKSLARRVIQRDEYTCAAAECLRRGGLEADHIKLKSRMGPSEESNESSLCGPHHRHIKHEMGALTLYGKAPDDLWVKMGERLYHKDRVVQPELDEKILDEDPWGVNEAVMAYRV